MHTQAVKTLTLRDFCSRSRSLQKVIGAAGEAVLTLSGRPVALLLSIEGGLEETLELVEQVRAQRAVRALRDETRASGADRLRPHEIEALVQEVRQKNRRRAARGAREAAKT